MGTKERLDAIKEACGQLIALCELLLNEQVPPHVKRYRKKIFMVRIDEMVKKLNASEKETSA
jgi:hypothetical protein